MPGFCMNIAHVEGASTSVESRQFFSARIDSGPDTCNFASSPAPPWRWSPASRRPTAPAPALSYTRDIQPIFTEKCVACHACYDSACQLNLGSGEGAARGASKLPVYDGERSQASQPTRLFYDAFGKAAGSATVLPRC
ncbi:hypothetical protein AB6846_22380 [Serratia proteamaculans]